MALRFRERQSSPRWAYIVIIVTAFVPLVITLALGDTAHLMIPLIVSIGVSSLFVLLFGVMDTELHDDHLLVTFGLLRLVKFRYAYTDIIDLKTRTYDPIGDYGGWGIKGWDNERALNARGNRGVELTIRNAEGKKPLHMMIGSQQPEALEAALRSVLVTENG